MAIDGVEGGSGLHAVLPIDRGSHDRRGKASQRPDLDDATRRQNADQRGEKKIIARANAAGITNIIERDHGVEKIQFARRRDLARMI